MKNSLYFLPLFFVIIAIFRISYAYNDIEKREEDFVTKQGNALKSLTMANRDYYQDLFIEEHIPFNEETLAILPAYSAASISKLFSEHNSLKIEIQTVSDRARNPDHQADSDQLMAIEYFKDHPDSMEYMYSNHDYYNYAYALKIDNKCLKCHGKREEAPTFMAQKYDKAYGYKLGDIRGIITVKFPKNPLQHYFYMDFTYSVFYDLFLLILLFILVYFMMKKFSRLNKSLESEVQKKTKELQTRLTTDALTGLPNRVQLLRILEQNDSPIHLALLNIDGFKEINDFYGHAIADKLLIALSESMRRNCIKGMTLYKMPADEYAVYMDQPIAHSTYIKHIKKIIQQLGSEKFIIEGIKLDVTFSCGIVFGEKELLIKADMALQKAKTENRAIVVYSKDIDNAEQIDKNLQGITILKKAIANDTIVPFYQPIYNLGTNKIEKYETLARVIDQDGKVLSPYLFLEVAQRSKLYPNITKAMIEKSFAMFAESTCDFSINLSLSDITNAKTVEYIRKRLSAFKACDRLVFEILESDKVENYSQLKAFIEMVKQYGVKIAIDDFGSGYSNFSHIMELDVDFLKIDASLIKDITTSANSRILVQGIVDFSKQLEMKTIAEYVESKEIMDTLRSMDIDYAQGYYIGRPSPELQEEEKE